MGILARPLELMRALRLPKGFAVCELGDQYVTAGQPPHKLAQHWYKKHGCGRYESIDGNGQGTLTHDLNLPLSADQLADRFQAFDLVTDFGTGEHIFDQAAVWRTLHSLTKIGGYIAFDRPSAGYPGHCFYLINEGLIRDIAAANAYDVVTLESELTTRGELVRGVLRRTRKGKFRVPQQGRYLKSLTIGGIKR